MNSSDQHPLPAVRRLSLKFARSRRRVRKKEVAEGEHERASREHGGALGEHERAQREHGRATREHIDETSVSGRAKRRDLSQRSVTCWPQFETYIYSILEFQIRYYLIAPALKPISYIYSLMLSSCFPVLPYCSLVRPLYSFPTPFKVIAMTGPPERK